MIIKYSDKFESIFYAVLCSNITGYFMVPKSQPAGLFEEEDHIDIDKINWNQVIDGHNRKFGKIKWLEGNSQFNKFRDNINLVLRFWQPFKYKIVIDIISWSIKYGLDFLDTNSTDDILRYKEIIKQIKAEVNSSAGYINLLPVDKNSDKFLVGEFNEESRIGDLVLKKLTQKYFGYNFVLRNQKFVYLFFQGKISVVKMTKLSADQSLSKLLEQLYREGYISKKKESEDLMAGLTFMPLPTLSFG